MHSFFLNSESLPKSDNIHVFIDLFKNTLREFENIATDSSVKVFRGIVTEKIPSEIILGDFTLANVINNIQDIELKKLAYSYFTKYPIEDHLEVDKIEDVLTRECFCTINKEEYNTLYLSFVAFLGRTSFSVPVHNDLKSNILKLTSRTKKGDLDLYNLFGESSNTLFIKTYLLKLLKDQLSIFDRLKMLLNDPIFPSSFEKSFFKLSLREQTSIVDEFEKCVNRSLITPLCPDNERIKDVSPSNAKCNVYELRVYSPTAIRVYFNEGKEKNYIGSVEKKSNPDQNKDIRKAYNIIYKLILTNE